MEEELLVTDTETASLEGGVCDIAIVKLDGDYNITWQVESLVDPERPINPGASAIHHITDKMVWAAPTLSEFMDMHGHPFDVPNPIICGHNIAFDIRMIGDYIPKQHKRLCTLKLSRLLWPQAENHQLQTLRYTFDLDAGTAHRAMGDVMTCVSLLRRIKSDMGLGLAQVMELLRKPLDLSYKLTFGKHKGVALGDLPSSYVEWLLNKSENLDPDIREALLTRLPKTVTR